ncbi:MAG TPA: hypothetical protein VFV39_07980 [Limnobacter sp.]|nr:hypothetical protein [Limnobacter sp.]
MNLLNLELLAPMQMPADAGQQPPSSGEVQALQTALVDAGLPVEAVKAMDWPELSASVFALTMNQVQVQNQPPQPPAMPPGDAPPALPVGPVQAFEPTPSPRLALPGMVLDTVPLVPVAEPAEQQSHLPQVQLLTAPTLPGPAQPVETPSVAAQASPKLPTHMATLEPTIQATTPVETPLAQLPETDIVGTTPLPVKPVQPVPLVQPAPVTQALPAVPAGAIAPSPAIAEPAEPVEHQAAATPLDDVEPASRSMRPLSAQPNTPGDALWSLEDTRRRVGPPNAVREPVPVPVFKARATPALELPPQARQGASMAVLPQPGAEGVVEPLAVVARAMPKEWPRLQTDQRLVATAQEPIHTDVADPAPGQQALNWLRDSQAFSARLRAVAPVAIEAPAPAEPNAAPSSTAPIMSPNAAVSSSMPTQWVASPVQLALPMTLQGSPGRQEGLQAVVNEALKAIEMRLPGRVELSVTLKDGQRLDLVVQAQQQRMEIDITGGSAQWSSDLWLDGAEGLSKTLDTLGYQLQTLRLNGETVQATSAQTGTGLDLAQHQGRERGQDSPANAPRNPAVNDEPAQVATDKPLEDSSVNVSQDGAVSVYV